MPCARTTTLQMLLFAVLVATAAPAVFVGRVEAQTTQPEQVVDVRVVGNRAISVAKIRAELKTRVGRPFDEETVERDVRHLATRGWFVDVRPLYERTPAGRVVIFQVSERPRLRYVQYLGNSNIKDKTLTEQTGLKVGDALDPYAVEEGRRKIEQYYRDHGYSRAQISILEGNQVDDQGAVYVINEGGQQRVLSVDFVGNTIASDARLKTQIKSKPGFLYIFKGYVDRSKIDEDLERLTAYYRSLGYFRARVGREIELSDSGDWAYLTFVIDEGPRYKIRDISILGSQKFAHEALTANLELKQGEYFDQAKMTKDVGNLRDLYGSQGHVFADVKADPRFLEEPGLLDLVYDIEEGARYRVGRITVHVEGDNPHTRMQTVLNRVSLRTGDIFDIRELRASERRLRASGLFVSNPQLGQQPRIVFNPPGSNESSIAGRDGGFRGQSPDRGPDPAPRRLPIPTLRPGVEVLDLNIEGELQLPESVKPQTQQPAPVVRGQSPDTRFYQHPAAQGAYGGHRLGATGPAAQGPNVRSAQYAPPASYAAPQYTAQPQSQVQPAQYGAPMQSGAYAGPPAQQPAPGSYVAPPVYAPPATGAGLPSAWPNTQPTPLYGGPGAAGGPAGPLFGPPTPEVLPTINPDIYVEEAQTGRFMLGVGVNSDAGVVGQITLDEQNFDWRRWPRSFEDLRNGTAFRGAGQRFRVELMPGDLVQRYMVNFQEPYLLDTNVALGLSGFYYTRRYRDWTEERLGGRVSLGYQLTPDLSAAIAYRGEEVTLYDEATPTPQVLADALGSNTLHGFKGSLTHDTRDSAFLPTEGHYIEVGAEQVVGSFQYPRLDFDARRYFLVRQRPDGSGRHVVSVSGRVGWTGDDTPIYDRFYAGGFSTIRGFRFRGIGPTELDVKVGGDFMLLGSVEYLFPITADDMLRGVAFVDMGTVENDVEINTFRVAPGIGLRVSVPALGPAPIALDFAVPIVEADTDRSQVFSFNIGLLR